MAVEYGAVDGHMQVGLDLWWDGDPAVGAVSVRTRTYARAVTWGFDDDQTMHITGDVVEDVPYRMVSPANTTTDQLVAARDFATNVSYGTVTWVGINARVSGAYDGSAPSHTRALQLPARPYLPPRSVSCSATRVSDTKHTIKWTIDADPVTGASPVDQYRVQRWDNVGETWAYVSGALAASVSSWTDTTTVADRQYRWRVVIDGPGGQTVTPQSAALSTTPKALTVAPTVAIVSGNIRVSWTDVSRSETTFDIYRRENGGGVIYVASVAAGDGATTGAAKTWTHTSPNVTRFHEYQVRARNAQASSAWSPWSSPIRIQDAPPAPTNVAVTRVSDVKHTITWDASGTVTGFYVDRWDSVTATWKQVANLTSGTVRTFTDSTTVADRKYFWRVRSYNSTGASETVSSPSQYTTPLAPLAPTATKTAAGIVVSWVDRSRSDTSWDVQRRENGGAWTLVSSVAVGDTTTVGESFSWTHTSPNAAVTHAYQVRPKNSLTGAWSPTSNVVQLQAPPNAPTNLTGVVVPTDGTATVRWRHNPVDSSTQTGYELRWAPTGTTAWVTTGKVTSTDQARVMDGAALTPGVYDWQVRTWGAHADPSPFSATATFTVSTRPTAAITAPETTLATNHIQVVWGYDDVDAHPQAAAQVTVTTGGTTIHDATVTGTGTTHDVPVIATNNTMYTVTVAVQDSTGLWSAPATVDVTVVYALPPAPVVGADDYDPVDGSVTITYDTPAPGAGEADAVTVTLEASFDSGETWHTVETGLPTGGTIKHATPLVGGVTLYRVTAVSALPSEAPAADVVMDTTDPAVHGSWMYLTGGPGFGQSVRVRSNPSVTGSHTRAKELHQFAGRSLPVEYAGDNTTATFTVAAQLVGDDDGASPLDELRAVAEWLAPVCFRNPCGGGSGPVRRFVSVLGVIYGYTAIPVRDIEFSLTEVDHDG